MKKLKKHLINNNYEYTAKKDEVHVKLDGLIVKIWYEQDYKEFFILVFDNHKAVMIDNYIKTYYKKTIKQLNKLATS